MRIARLSMQALALLLQTYFIVETIRLYISGYVMYMGEPIESAWFSMLFTLLVVVACELISFVEGILFMITNQNIYSKIYFVLIFINAGAFMTMAYYSTVGTIICLSIYTALFVLRIVNLVSNSIYVFKNHKYRHMKSIQPEM